MKTRITLFFCTLLTLTSHGQGLKYSQYPTTPRWTNDFLLLWADPGQTNYAQTAANLEAQISTLATNAAATTATNKSHLINVKDFGAVGNGVANDTAAIQAALWATTNGMTSQLGGKTHVYIPAGHYLISDTLLIPAHGTRIFGDGRRRTRISMTAHDKHGIARGGTDGQNYNGTNGMWYIRLEGFSLTKTIVPVSTGTSSALYFKTGATASQQLSRAEFNDIELSGWFVGMDIEHAVVVTAFNCENYANLPAFLNKVDSATFINCFSGDGMSTLYGTNLYGTNYSAVYSTKVSGYAPGFALTVIGGESRNANTIFDHGSGALNVIGHNVEFNHWGPTFNIRSTAYSAFIGGVRIAGRNAGSTNAIYQFGANMAQKTRIEPGNYNDVSTYPQIEIATAGDWVNYSGPPLTVTNLGSATSYSATRPLLGAGSGVTVTTNSPNNWTVAATGGTTYNLENSTNLPPAGIAGWPADDTGYLANDGAGNLSWGTPSGGSWYESGGTLRSTNTAFEMRIDDTNYLETRDEGGDYGLELRWNQPGVYSGIRQYTATGELEHDSGIFRNGWSVGPATDPATASINATGDLTVNSITSTTGITADSVDAGDMVVSSLQFATNLFSGTVFLLGKSSDISTGTSFGFTAVSEPPSTNYGFGELTILATANITLTNAPTIRASDFLTSRTITNGNTATIAVQVKSGLWTNMSIVQFK